MGARLRASAALSAAALALHQLRYLADGPAATLARDGHGYLALVAPLIAVLCAVALAHLAGAWQRELPPGRRFPLLRLWLASTFALLAVFTCQEALETVLSPSRDGPIAMADAGGWLAIPLALALGFLVALLLRGADALLAARVRPTRAPVRPRNASHPHRPTHWRAIGGIARHLAGRGPPLTA